MKFIRSWLFVPADSERKLSKAHEVPADALILDLEGAVAIDRQGIARELTRGYLQEHVDQERQQLWVRIYPLDHDLSLNYLAAVLPSAPNGIVFPKVNAADDINPLAERLSALEAAAGIEIGSTKIMSVATETAAALLTFHTYLEGVSNRLVALTWGGEDLAAAFGASNNRNPFTGDYDYPYLTLKPCA